MALLQHCVLSFLCDGDLDRTLALRVLCRRLRPLVEHHAVQWMQRVLPTLLCSEYCARLAALPAASSSPLAAAAPLREEEQRAPAARPGGLYELGDACWLSVELRRMSVRDGRGGWITLTMHEADALCLYGLRQDDLSLVNSWRWGRRSPGIYRKQLDVLHLALTRWSHARRLIDWQRGRPQAEQQLLAKRAQRLVLENRIAMSSSWP